MTYITKTVSSSAIITKVYRLLRPTDSNWIFGAIDDMGWAIQAIGYHAGFIDKTTQHDERIISVDHRAKLPSCIERIKFVEVFTDSINDRTVFLNPDGTVKEIEETDYCSRKTQKLNLGSDLTGYGLSSESPRTSYIVPNEPYYQLNGNYIITSLPTCELKLHYKAFNVDCDGFPLIIDDFNYKTCVYSYVIMNMLATGDYKTTAISYVSAKNDFEEYLPKAQNACKMPSIDGMARFEAAWKRMNLGLGIDNNYFMGDEVIAKINF